MLGFRTAQAWNPKSNFSISHVTSSLTLHPTNRMFDSLKSLFGGSNTPPPYARLSGGEAVAKLNQKGVLFVDVRENSEFASGHIPGAKHIPMSLIANRAGELANAEEVVVVCASGSRSSAVCRHLAANGAKNLFNLEGGMFAWMRAGGKVVR